MTKDRILATLGLATWLAMPSGSGRCDDVMAVKTADGQEGVGIVTFNNDRQCVVIVPRHVFCSRTATCSTVRRDHEIYDDKGSRLKARALLNEKDRKLEYLMPTEGASCGSGGGFTTAAGQPQDLLRRFPSGFLKVAQVGGQRLNVPVEIVSYDNMKVTVRALRDPFTKGMSGSPLIVGSDGAIVAILNEVCTDVSCGAGTSTALRIDFLKQEIESVLSLAGAVPTSPLLKSNIFVLKMREETSLDDSEVTLELTETRVAVQNELPWIKAVMRTYAAKRIDHSQEQYCFTDRLCHFQMHDRSFSIQLRTIGTNDAWVRVEELQ